MCDRDDFAQVLVTLEVACEQPHVAGLLLGAQLIDFGKFFFVNEINFTAEQGFNAVFFGLFEEAGQAVEDTVVGDGQGLHAQFCGARAKSIYAGTTIQQTVVSMDV